MADTNNGGAEDTPLSIRHYERDGRLVVEAVGEVTSRNAHLLDQALQPRPEAATLPVTVDLRRVDFMERNGLSALVQASKRLRSAAEPRAPRIVVTPGGQPDRALRLWTLDTILEIAHGLDGEIDP